MWKHSALCHAICPLDGSRFYLLPVMPHMAEIESSVETLAHWRNLNRDSYPTRFTATTESTRKWLIALCNNPDRIFWLIERDRSTIGTIGLQLTGEDLTLNLVQRGRGKPDGSMTRAVTMIHKLVRDFGRDHLDLLVLSSNTHAIEFYMKLGYKFLCGEVVKSETTCNMERLVPTGQTYDQIPLACPTSLWRMRCRF